MFIILTKYGKTFFQFAVLVIFIGSLFVGCKSRESSQPSNPFAMNRQTAPPPATFSHQAQYLGQTPGGYVPQLPATTYPPAGTSVPNTIPANVPLPNGTGTPASVSPTMPSGGYGSINGSDGATLFQTSAISSPSTATLGQNDWAASTTSSISAEIPTTRETVFQNLESKNNSVLMTDLNGNTKTTTLEPETFAVSSSQMITQVVGDSFTDAVPATVPAQPQSVYAGKYQ